MNMRSRAAFQMCGEKELVHLVGNQPEKKNGSSV
jgi:hypothetical protein